MPLYLELAQRGDRPIEDKKVGKALINYLDGHGVIYRLIQKGNINHPMIKLISDVRVMDKAKLSEFLVGKHNMVVLSFNKLYGEMEFEEGGRLLKESHGHWSLIFDRKASKSLEDVREMLELVLNVC